MNFDDTPQEAEFRSLARKWVEANAPKQYEAELSKSSLGRIRLEKDEIVDVGKRWQKKKASEILGINASTLYRKLIAYGVEKPGGRDEDGLLLDGGESEEHAA